MPGGMNITVCVVYRRPNSDYQNFHQFYSDTLEISLGTKTIICDDFNLDLLQYQSSNAVDIFVELSFETNFPSLINMTIRITSHSSTVIIHIWYIFARIILPRSSEFVINTKAWYFISSLKKSIQRLEI